MTTDTTTPKTDTTAEPASVHGWAYEGRLDAPPAVIVNPEASTADLIQWAKAQLWQANQLLELMGCGTFEACTISEAAGAVRHFTGQAEAVLRVACDRPAEQGAAA